MIKSPRDVTDRLSRPRTIRCAICECEFDPASSKAMPFCSNRCRHVDLSRWLTEGYTLPYEPPEDDESLQGESVSEPID